MRRGDDGEIGRGGDKLISDLGFKIVETPQFEITSAIRR
jgi:hypothetical protein